MHVRARRVYWVGPLVGASVAATVANWLFLSNPARVKELLIANRGAGINDIVLPEAYSDADVTRSPRYVIANCFPMVRSCFLFVICHSSWVDLLRESFQSALFLITS